MSDNQADATGAKKKCFVVMGFGVKTDYATGRKLDLDKSYKYLIKPTVQSRGVECIRADEIRHSGAIDLPMYRELLTADLVIADLSTANPNALYELGIRHALRPHATIVISENKLPYPFDLNHIAITSYTHLGDAIDIEEAEKFRERLGGTLDAILRTPQIDSPVYTYLAKLVPPSMTDEGAAVASQVKQALDRASDLMVEASTATQPEASEHEQTLAMLVEQGERAIRDSRFVDAKASFAAARELCKGSPNSGLARNCYLTQRLVLATYKAKQPDELSALDKALELLQGANLEESNDPETLGLAGAIEKRLYRNGRGAEHLERALSYYWRGYLLRNDWYNGINVANLLEQRAADGISATADERLADTVWAKRICREVIALCDRDIEQMREREARAAARSDTLKHKQEDEHFDQRFWCLATRAEAYRGIGDNDHYEETRQELEAVPHAQWMMEAFEGQLNTHQVAAVVHMAQKAG
jgi:hypothetical protein